VGGRGLFGGGAKRLPRGDELGVTVYELGPGSWLPFHVHHGAEEYLVVLRGRPTLRTGDGSRELAEGEAVHVPRGPDRPRARERRAEATAAMSAPASIELVDLALERSSLLRPSPEDDGRRR
jgi:mannose-6-phosphate isomerase-like protein (cupin superfamily)